MVSRQFSYQERHDPQTARRVLNHYGRSFAFARYFLGSPFDKRATDLYAFCRWLDDLADEIPKPEGGVDVTDIRQQQINIRFQLLNQLKNVVDNPGCYFLLEDGLPLNSESISILLKGVINDLQSVIDKTPRIIIDQEQLIDYCHQVAGSVGLLMCNIFEVNDPKAYSHAVALGIAMQLTNIGRDFYTDLEEQRRYIPSSWLPTIGNMDINDDAVNSVTAENEINQARIRIINLADQYYQYGIDGITYLPTQCRTAIHLAALIYRGIGVKLKKQIKRSPRRRFKVNFFDKLKIAFNHKLSITNVFNPDIIYSNSFIEDKQFTASVIDSINRFQRLASSIPNISSINRPSSINENAPEITKFDLSQLDGASNPISDNHQVPLPACDLYWFQANSHPAQLESEYLISGVHEARV